MATAWHAIHPSPYSDDCPDCAGYADDLAPARGILRGMLLGALLWLALIAVAVWMVRRG